MAPTVDKKSEDQIIVVPGTVLGQASLYLRREHLLSASIVRNLSQKETAFYRFVQQPPVALRPFGPVVDILHSEISGLNMPLVPYGVAQPVTHKYDAPINAIPISCINPEGFEVAIPYNHESVMNDEGSGSDTTGILQLSYNERKENWFIRSLPRKSGIRSDQYYVHLRTDKQLRSLKEVFDFVMHGVVPNRNKNGRKASGTMASDPSPKVPENKPSKIRGDTLIDKVKVGYYNLTKDKIHRIVPTASSFEDSKSSHLGTESKKRKRAEETSVQQILESDSSELEHLEMSDIWFDLYDMVPKQK